MLEAINPVFLPVASGSDTTGADNGGLNSPTDEFIPPSLVIEDLPLQALNGITNDQAAVLNEAGIKSVLDLADAFVFNAADELLQISRSPSRVENQLDALPSSLIAADYSEGIQNLPLLSPSVIPGVTRDFAAKLDDWFGIVSVAELALWPGFHTARLALGRIADSASIFADPLVPTELVPILGNEPVERYIHQRFVVDDEPTREGQHEKPLTASPLNLASVSKASHKPLPIQAGALLSFEQSWTVQALSLGNLLHTVALAPGESTNISVIDWTRRVQQTTSSETSQQELLENLQERARAIGEITTATGRETLTGQSTQNSMTSLASAGGSGYSVAGGSSQANSADSQVHSVSSASSSGSRDMASSTSQQINDRTSQAASELRSRRASVVRESLQSETEELRTRNVTNYNHMHALSIQYFEVIQIYRVLVSLTGFTPCLYLPFTPIRKWTEAIIERYHRIWLKAALTDEVALQLLYPQVNFRIIGLRPAGQRTSVRELKSDARLVVISLDNVADDQLQKLLAEMEIHFIIESEDGTHSEIAVLRTRVDLAVHSIRTISVRLKHHGLLQGLRGAVPLSVTASIEHSGSARTQRVTASALLGSDEALATTPLIDTVELPLFRVSSELYDADLLAHFNRNHRYYNDILLMSMEDAEYAALLDCYSIGKRPLLDIVQTPPLGVSGQQVIFGLSSDKLSGDAALNQLERNLQVLHNRVLGKHVTTFEATGRAALDNRQVPVASGGTFVEAVQGQANSAELIDLGRWWNWQDSPIPLSAPEIAALQAASRGSDGTPATGSLGDALIKLTESGQLSAPAGIGQLLSALGKSSLFADLTGVEEAIEDAKSALTKATEQSNSTGTQSAANLTQGLKLTTDAVNKMVETISGFVTTLVSSGVSGTGVTEALGEAIAGAGTETSDDAAVGDVEEPTDDTAND